MDQYTNDFLKTLISDDPLKPYQNPSRRSNGGDLNRRKTNGGDEDDIDDDCDCEVWEILSGEFERVQSVLDQNRALIQQVNENHQSKVPDNLVKNVALIHEINSNISKVVSIYSDLSVNFTNLVRQRKGLMKKSHGRMNCSGDGKRDGDNNGGSEVVDGAVE